MKKELDKLTEHKYSVVKTASIVLFAVGTALMLVTVFLSVFAPQADVMLQIAVLLEKIVFCGFLMCGIYYCAVIFPLKKSLRLLYADGNIKYISEIYEKLYETNGKIAFSDHLFYDMQSRVIIPYKSILWVYRRSAGRYIFRTVNNGKFRSFIDDSNLQELLRAIPHIMRGNTSGNYNEYISKVSDFCARHEEDSAVKKAYIFITKKLKGIRRFCKERPVAAPMAALILAIGYIVAAACIVPDRLPTLLTWLILLIVFWPIFPAMFFLIGGDWRSAEFSHKKKTQSTDKEAAAPSPQNMPEKDPAAEGICKCCKKKFPPDEIDENGYCKECSATWWQR